MAKTQIKNYVFKPGIGAKDNLFSDAYNLVERNIPFIKEEAIAWLQSQVEAEEPGFEGYSLNESSLKNDIQLNLEAYLYDLRYGGNSKIHERASYYWEKSVPQIAGSRIPEAQTYGFIKDLIKENILTNTAYDAENLEELQIIDTDLSPASEALARTETLFSIGISVIENGLSGLPVLELSGVGTVTILGQYDIEDILLMTNVTKNEIIFNFSNPSTGGNIELLKNGVSDLFPSYLQTTDAVTQISLNYDTTGHSVDDEIQIFVERVENGKSQVITRPYDFGTDAIERMRVATPLSMLDADFEYGLQPTKWAAIGTLRGYPSVYEIPGTDTPVATVVTDASVGTEGVGQSLITVTTIGPHGFTPGTPITIKALEDAVNGAARAEGSFTIVETPTDNTFTYYAKSKVGNSEGDVLSTTYTQLRKAGFYTGANIGDPAVSVTSQGSAGTVVVEIDIPIGETRIPYDGPTPELGAPLVNANITTGSQVTGTIETSAGGGTYITPKTIGNVNIGDTTVEVQDPTGIVPDLAVDNQNDLALYIENINGNILEFTGQFQGPIIGNNVIYSSIEPNPNFPEGADAIFDVTTNAGIYTVTDIVNPGVDYKTGDRIVIGGGSLGGVSPDNDLTIIVEDVDNSGGILAITPEGNVFEGNESFQSITGELQGNSGSGAEFDVEYLDNVYTVSVPSPDFSTGYIVGDLIEIEGEAIDNVNGSTPENNLIIRVTGVGIDGSISSVESFGTAPDITNTYLSPSFTTSGSGIGFDFNVIQNGSIYSIEILNEGSNFLPGDTVSVLGTELGGNTPDNNLTITVNEVGPTGNITVFSLSGTAFNGGSVERITGTPRIGINASFDITLDNGSFIVSINNPGSQYGPEQQIIIPAGADTFGGSSPENDLTITINSVDSIQLGLIQTISITGTAPSGAGSFNSISGTNEQITGTDLLLEIERDLDQYTSIILQNSGTGYKKGNTFTVNGSQLDGDTPNNDITFRVTEVDTGGSVIDFQTFYNSAYPGDDFDLKSIITMSEPTTGVISKADTVSYEVLASLEVEWPTAHGLVPGDTFIVDVGSDDTINNHSLASGSFFITDIPALNKITYQARAGGFIDTGTDNDDPIVASVYPRPDSFFIHRPYDGGVQLGTGGPQHGAQAIRQSKKYIRYQSGKGIMYTTGALFAPSYDLRSVTAEDVEVGSLITIVTDDNDHGVQEGGIVRLLGIETPGYNSGPSTAIPPQFDYEVVNVIDERTFQVRSQRRLGSTTATLEFGAQMSVISWHGATVRSGIFDDQNGIFWEYDGTQISVVQRTGTFQIAGTLTLQRDFNLVTGTNTRFRDQLKAGDKIIIKGMTHVISHVNSQTEMTITPDWRGVRDISGVKAMLVIDKKVKQSEFNLDKLDGTGPSGYNIDVAKMQMIGIQYSWYGAGFIDFMLRGADGNFVYAHRMRNSNVNTEAFMRSGNLPVRYEVTNEGPSGKLAQAVDTSQTEIFLEDSSFFPEKGFIYIDNEIIQFFGKNDSENKLTGCIRGDQFTNFQAGAQRFYSAGNATTHSARTGVILISNTITPLISHWGSAFITDGQFDDDRGYIFSYAETGVEVSTTQKTAFMLRLAPSVSNALVGNLGERELLNRAQLLLQGIEITSDGFDESNNPIIGGIVVEGILNPQNYPEDPSRVRWSGLSGLAQGGQPSFAQVASEGAIEWTTDNTSTSTSLTVAPKFSKTLTNIVRERDDEVRISQNELLSVFLTTNADIIVGELVENSKLPPGTRIRRQTGTFQDRFTGEIYYRYDLSREASDDILINETINIVRGGDIDNRNFALFEKTEFESAPIVIGTNVTGGSVTFPAGTQVNQIEQETFADIEYYVATFNRSFEGTLTAGSGTVEFTFTEPPFGQPGETVFSFIATPGERSELDLSFLKELTNTPLGGRGTYPNGPDVLAINVFKVKGTPSDANVIVKWGEAQA